ncbi:HNH endonuclease [Halobacteria archaeon AArc-m2/3/4]|uniref:HNH endonuclease n=1 Tax=Natronoglomus mannanivorans TaxID=2979990 RepID=A0AAP2YY33_9EURY|nr:HNH endonuclease [Halobacteria archaeon AArc-xg1-1]MCU4973754.1 HNH endonuclease [Halobacteria archaeon AArc-m2/3/4]
MYCPSCVENESWRDPPELEGADHPRWNGGKVTVDCDVCSDSVERYPSNVHEVVCCSEDCRGQWLSEEFTGEGHPNWAGGGNETYGKGWAAVREAALERDDYQCVHCGTTSDELGRNPDVHHIVPVRAFVASEEYEKTDAHVLENVVSLCLPCHRKAEFGRISAATLLETIGVSRSGEDQNEFGWATPAGS